MSFPLPGRILPLAPGTFRALAHRNFRLLWIGQLVSLTGSWMQSTAQGWLVLRLTDSAFYLGLVGFCNFLPVMVLSLPAGAVADRLRPRAALVAVQAFALANAVGLTVVTAAGIVRPWHVIAFALGNGTAAAFEIPIRQKFLQDLVGRDDLANAIALNSLAFNGARLLGPSAAGFLLAAAGEAACFLVNALSYVAVLIALLRIVPPEHAAPPGSPGWRRQIGEGIAYAVRSRRVRTLLALVIVSSMCGMPYQVLLPVFARDLLGVGSSGLGLLMGSAGLGAVVGALYVAGRRSHRRSAGVVAGSMGAFGAGLIGFAASRSFPLSMAFLAVSGAALIVQMATSNTLLQLTAPADLRGRVVSIYVLAFAGSVPFGSLIAGWAARHVGAPATVAVGGAACAIAAAAFATRIPAIRRAAQAREEAAGGAPPAP